VRRRGTVLVLALGVLAVLSIAALSYVTIVRLDRQNVQSVTTRQNHGAMANIVIEEIQALVGSDPFNNQRVSPTERDKASAAFTNGEFTDFPSVDLSSFNTKLNPSAAGGDSPAAMLDPFEPGPTDDAWLAVTEPEWTPVNPDATRRVRQVSNLRSLYTWSPGAGKWVRGDGRFVDLGSWLLSTRNGHGDPSVNLADWSYSRVVRLGPDDGVDVDVFDRQINDLSDFPSVGGSFQDLGPVKPSDERQLVDLDGDLRPDARWTVLDSLDRLGGASGLKWVVAAKIVDASAMINFNSSIEFGPLDSYVTSTELGDGRTPADVDLAGLLEDLQRPSVGMPYDLPVLTDRVFGNLVSFQRHLEGGLGLDTLLAQVIAESSPAGLQPLMPWLRTDSTDPLQRRVFWEEFGSNPLSRAVSRYAKGYSLRELVDLGAFGTTNHTSFVSRLEQHLDGTENPLNGYLPNNTDLAYGPMRSKETSAARFLRSVPGNTGLPTPTQIKDSIRRFLTPVSGAGQYSPVPVLDDGDPRTPFAGPYRNNKIRVNTPLGAGRVAEAFQSFVWALAPLATDRPLTRLQWGGSLGIEFGVASEDAHYGGSLVDAGPPFRSIARHLSPVLAAGAPLASFAVVTAASMAVNLADATDRALESSPPSSPALAATVDGPTIAAIYNTTNAFAQTPDLAAMGAIPLTPRFSHGVIPGVSLPWIPVGAARPFVLVGLDRQPFLREVTLLAVYSDWDADVAAPTSLNKNTGPSEPDELLGCGVVAVLMNPWPDPIQIDDRYAIVFPEGGSLPTDEFIDDPVTGGALARPFRMRMPAGMTRRIEPGESLALVWLLDPSGASNPTTAWAAIEAKIQTQIEDPKVTLVDTNVTPTPDDPGGGGQVGRMPFVNLLGPRAMGAERGVLLTYRNSPSWTGFGNGYEVVIDRMRPKVGEQFPAFTATMGGPPVPFDFQATTLGMPNVPDNVPGGFSQATWFESPFLGLGYPALSGDPRWTGFGAPNITGRVLYTSCLSRATKPWNVSGNPARGVGSISPVVIEERASNHVKMQQDAVGWLFDSLGGPGVPTPMQVVNGIINAPESIVDDSTFLNGSGDNPLMTNFPDRHLRGPQPTATTFADDADPYFLVDATIGNERLPQFSLFVPNAGLIAVSDTLRLSQFAHECHDCGVASTANDLTHWRTVSEKLAMTLRNDNGEGSLGNLVNQHLGILDPTRYVLGADLISPNVPDTMRVPLALRVPDCFQALPGASELTQGTINLNTAPEEVLSQLPLIRPRWAMPTYSYNASTPKERNSFGLSQRPMPPGGAHRVLRMTEYRDPAMGPLSLSGIGSTELPAGLRAGFLGGFATPAELAIIGRWNTAPGGLNGFPNGAQQGTFLELGADMNSNDHSPLQLAEYARAGSRTDEATPHDAALRGSYAGNDVVNPRDDAEERLAIYRAVSNIVTARSDVYLAWFILRGYDPQTIERISFDATSITPAADPNNPTADEVNRAMDEPSNNFAPTYESRWLVVLDRSQTESGAPLTQPTDRPRVLLKVQLPSAKP
jgi:hypothetical protein